MTEMSRPPRVVVVGGGFGGHYAARALAKHAVRVTVVDRHNYHLFQPLLYQCGARLTTNVVTGQAPDARRPEQARRASFRPARAGRSTAAAGAASTLWPRFPQSAP